MINTWWVTRPKRKLDSVPETLALIADHALDEQWSGERGTHLAVEEALEQAGLKRPGDRRDQRGGGARTYFAWLKSLGLIFQYNGQTKLTLAGEAIINGDSPVSVLKGQILKYQFPSAFSISRNVEVHPRFKIHPFWFLLKLLRDYRLGYYLTQDEIARVVIGEAQNESDATYERVVYSILRYREEGGIQNVSEFVEQYGSTRERVNPDCPFRSFDDTANTFLNWLDYTQLVVRESGKVSILPEKISEVDSIIGQRITFIDRPEDEVFFQRKYGIDPKHNKDTRNLTQSSTITATVLAQNKVRTAFIAESIKRPIFRINAEIIDLICERTGISEALVEDTLSTFYPNGAVSSFMSNYFQMAFNGREEATEFEKATCQLFDSAFGFETHHVGPIGLTPDVLLISNESGYQAIIDNKAYSKYSISNDHHNRMVHNYIRGLPNYSSSPNDLAFFSYIAGGFSSAINGQLASIYEETQVKGSAISVSTMIEMVERNQKNSYSHEDIKNIFSVGRKISSSDL